MSDWIRYKLAEYIYSTTYKRDEVKNVDMQEYCESQGVTVDLVKSSPSKQLVIVNTGETVVLDNRKRVKFSVDIDGKVKQWTPNKTSILYLSKEYGFDSARWMGKTVSLSIEIINGKESVIGRPMVIHHLPTNGAG